MHRCPLLRAKLTLFVAEAMSAMCQQETWGCYKSRHYLLHRDAGGEAVSSVDKGRCLVENVNVLNSVGKALKKFWDP